MFSFLPEALEPMLRGGRLSAVDDGCSPARMYHITGAAVTDDCFLKIDIPRSRGLDREAAACLWLKGRFPAPEVLYFGESQGCLYLLTRAVPGMGACCGDSRQRPEATVRLLARAMDALHRLDSGGCPLSNSVDDLLRGARIRLRPIPPDEQGRKPADWLRELWASRPPEGSVFCHGDFCLSNVLVQDRSLTGVIDLCDAGVGNRHLDLAQCCRSIRQHFGDGRYAEDFLDEYGRDRVDDDELSWFTRLNHLYE